MRTMNCLRTCDLDLWRRTRPSVEPGWHDLSRLRRRPCGMSMEPVKYDVPAKCFVRPVGVVAPAASELFVGDCMVSRHVRFGANSGKSIAGT